MMNTYDEIADIFMQSLAAQVSGVTREQFIARLKEKCPTEADARRFFEQTQVQAKESLAHAEMEAAKHGGKIVGIAYPTSGR